MNPQPGIGGSIRLANPRKRSLSSVAAPNSSHQFRSRRNARRPRRQDLYSTTVNRLRKVELSESKLRLNPAGIFGEMHRIAQRRTARGPRLFEHATSTLASHAMDQRGQPSVVIGVRLAGLAPRDSNPTRSRIPPAWRCVHWVQLRPVRSRGRFVAGHSPKLDHTF